MKLKAATAKDINDLDFLKDHADVVGLSFVNNASDVHQIIDEMEARGMHEVGLVVKIETVSAFEDLPIILLALMRHKRIGLMIARGDLGLEVGWERLAEVQEEILWLAEAGWIPTIWATQVLEKLTKQGIPTRAEITDSAAGIRAECVMLNKGKYILNSLRTLSDILTKMSSHQYHRRPAMRKLNVAERVLQS
ncbi:MAG: hypothetical protein J4F31_04565 [Flavobacteriales bacterium]|nr:hypothetical protein [Flavobacteriales bacterium]